MNKPTRHKHQQLSTPLWSTDYYRQLLVRLTRHLTPKHHCLLCDEPDQARICCHCEAVFSRPQHSCQRCALPLQHFALVCGQCLKQPPAYDAVFSPYLYNSPLSQLIYDYKQKGREYTGKALADLFYLALSLHYAQQHLTLPTLITPIPLHWRDQWRRGFNQSAFFSRTLATHFGLKQTDQLRRIKRTPPQKALSRAQRMRSLRNSFIVDGDLTGHSVAVVDDVMTTGATANAAAIALKKAGAKEVTVWALARTPTD